MRLGGSVGRLRLPGRAALADRALLPPLLSSNACPAARVVLVAPDEWAQGTVRVKDLASRTEADVPVDQLV